MIGFSQLFLMFALGMPYKTTGTQSKEQPNSSCSPQRSPLSYARQPLLRAHSTFPVKQRLEPVSKSKLPSHPCCTQLQGDFLAPGPIPFQSHSRALTFQHRNVVWTKNKGMFLDPIFSKLPGKTNLERQPFCTSSDSHTAQHWLSLPQRNS